mmetsp:Transcript_25663/g.57897  ORF Transcript_25663/g.57897 Transcript_25663/m.57897 type:complete len:89 (+) Transcript_25663:316-582(+)
MTKRKRGGQSKGGVYALDEDRKVQEYKNGWTAFGYTVGRKGISLEKLQRAGRIGLTIDERTYVHATQCEKRYEIGEILPKILPPEAVV